MDRVELRWARRSRGVPVVLLVVGMCVVWVTTRYGPVPAGQVEEWAGLPAGVRSRAGPTAYTLRATEQALHPRRARPYALLTWEQGRELAQSDLRSLCEQARRMVESLGSGDVLPDGCCPTAAETGRKMRQTLATVAQEEAKLQEQLRRTRGPSDLFAVQQEVRRIRLTVDRARLWFRARRMMDAPGVSRRGKDRGDPAGRVRDLPPAPSREGTGRRR